ncbi:MAG TPA: ketol-acid reductoisomerase, partial [Candidatus Krumholzibacteria bacterium]|nr:ketol-acid reductoisomerase [Candidatus Krumholzibacteria bacterium]
SLKVALAYAKACGALAGGGFLSSFREEAVSDLFGEQTVLCGGLIELITAAWELLVARGYSAEGAYFECLHEVKIITDLVHEKGVDGMREGISPTAAFGGLRAGPRVIGKESRAAMEKLLDEIEDGSFAKEFLKERAQGSPWLKRKREEEAKHPMQETGRGLRAFLSRCRLNGPKE